MQVFVVTLFPELYVPFLTRGIIKRAREEGKVSTQLVPLREFGVGKHKQVDDYPYGGGGGMLLKPEPFFSAVERIEKQTGTKPYVVLLSASGKLCDQKKLYELSQKESLVLLCGRYEGVDERVALYLADEELAVASFVAAGGDAAALMLLEGILRLIPDVIAKHSLREESFEKGLLEYPQYTRPENFRGWRVPEVLLSGNHEAIARWREEEARRKTERNRPDLLTTVGGKVC